MVDSLFVYILLLVLPLHFFPPCIQALVSLKPGWQMREKEVCTNIFFGLFAHFPIHVDGKAIAINLFIF